MTTNLFQHPEWMIKLGDGPEGWTASSHNGSDTLDGAVVDWKRPNLAVDAGKCSIWLNNGALWAAVTQIVPLVVGATYRLSCTYKADLQHGGVLAGDVLSGEFRFSGVSDWTTGAILPFGQDRFPNVTFQAAVALASLGFEVRGRHQLDVNRFHLSLPLLELVSLPNDPGVPTNPPAPTTDKYASLLLLLDERDAMIRVMADQVTKFQYGGQGLRAEVERLKRGGV